MCVCVCVCKTDFSKPLTVSKMSNRDPLPPWQASLFVEDTERDRRDRQESRKLKGSVSTAFVV